MIFKDLTTSPTSFLIFVLKKTSVVQLGLGVFIGTTIMLAGIASKENDFEGTIKLAAAALVLLLASVFLLYFFHKRLIPEIEERLRAHSKRW